MSQEVEPAAAVHTAASLEDLPVGLDFEIGSLSVPLGQLASLRPGYTFRLKGRPDGVRVTIRANGVRVGQGELVAIGDSIGVQLLSIDPIGSDTQARPERAAFR